MPKILAYRTRPQLHELAAVGRPVAIRIFSGSQFMLTNDQPGGFVCGLGGKISVISRICILWDRIGELGCTSASRPSRYCRNRGNEREPASHTEIADALPIEGEFVDAMGTGEERDTDRATGYMETPGERNGGA